MPEPSIGAAQVVITLDEMWHHLIPPWQFALHVTEGNLPEHGEREGLASSVHKGNIRAAKGWRPKSDAIPEGPPNS